MHAVVTGSSKGIGKAIAYKLASLNYNVLLCARGKELLEEVKQDIQQQFPTVAVYALATDLSKKENCNQLAQYALEIFESVDVLVNNTGQYVASSISNEVDDLLETMLSNNLFSAYHLTRALIPSMKKRKEGCIINIGSVAGLQAYQNCGAYGISKFALLGFSKNLRLELMPFGIKVCCINPAATFTASWDGSGIDEQRILAANDIAEVVAMICSLSTQAVAEEITLRSQLGDL